MLPIRRSTKGCEIGRILEQDAGVPAAVRAELDSLAEACELLLRVLAGGGRWFNLGAGTSGRIGVLDAAEIPPTFGLDRDRVQGVIAGGDPAMTRSVEGAEDDSEAARRDLPPATSARMSSSVFKKAMARCSTALLTVPATRTPWSGLLRHVKIAIEAQRHRVKH